MRPDTIARLARSGKMWPMVAVMRIIRGSYRAAFLGTALGEGLLQRLATPATFEVLVKELGIPPHTREGLRAWLALGIRLGDLGLDERGYRLRSRLARRLARPGNDPIAALLEQVSVIDHRYITQIPARARAGKLFAMAETDDSVVIRASRAGEELIHEAIDLVVPPRGRLRLLEVGCGTGTHIRHAAQRNPDLTAVGLDIDPAAADVARANIERWGLSDRVTIDTGDIRTWTGQGADVATLHQNIYYFRDRVAALARIRTMLRPGGALLVTSMAGGRSAGVASLNLWGAMTEGATPLPSASQVAADLDMAGYERVETVKLVPDGSFYAVIGRG
ncbi:cyclopropane-fatty-acyl-phospholipid synthase family protein [Georgenia sp. SYP-B2076]|uniref:SAM-dependent methyltransferase n=1 Tax=Georgenia sp. SYP-B2076 TaxID=2495881 RepID=UPI000F8CFB73|nr:class I SAM-dependent methyltransferase [Georgenia sp. SYP-B2076]